MAKNSPLRATGAHIGIVGHITKQELLRHITATELANGFFNRFMVVCVQRSKTLPFGGRLGSGELDRVREQVRLAARFASIAQQITFDPHARERWIAAYDELSRGEVGLVGAATARPRAPGTDRRRPARTREHPRPAQRPHTDRLAPSERASANQRLTTALA